MKVLTLFPSGIWERYWLGLRRVWAKRKKWWLGSIGFLLLLVAVISVWRWHWIKKCALVVVNGRALTLEEIVERVKKAPGAYQEYLKDDVHLILEDQINQELLLQEASRRRWRYRKRLKPLMEQYYQELLVKELVEQEIVSKLQVPEEQMRTYYQTHLNDFLIPDKYRLQEIVVATQEDAENILNRLILGEDFGVVARRDSISNTREKGGDLGWIPKDKLDPVLLDVVSQMKPGQILGKVIKTSLGYHLLKLTGYEPERFQTYDEARPFIKNIFIVQQKREAIEKYIKELRDRGFVKIFEEKLEKLKEKIQ
ncbi:MAG: peptidylprolyl isomerase [Candidatus Omnitrophica bacterium]|nr:peptidylprolyl isomerase [Candidatus Omnitrophota bacterium]